MPKSKKKDKIQEFYIALAPIYAAITRYVLPFIIILLIVTFVIIGNPQLEQQLRTSYLENASNIIFGISFINLVFKKS